HALEPPASHERLRRPPRERPPRRGLQPRRRAGEGARAQRRRRAAALTHTGGAGAPSVAAAAAAPAGADDAARPRITAAARSAIAITGALVFPRVTISITDAP